MPAGYNVISEGDINASFFYIVKSGNPAGSLNWRSPTKHRQAFVGVCTQERKVRCDAVGTLKRV